MILIILNHVIIVFFFLFDNSFFCWKYYWTIYYSIDEFDNDVPRRNNLGIIENCMISVKRVLEYTNVPQEAPLESSTSRFMTFLNIFSKNYNTLNLTLKW